METESLFTTGLALLEGASTTGAVWLVTVFASVPLALALSVVRKSGSGIADATIGAYSSLVRGTPLLFQLMFVYFGFPLLFGIRLPPFACASIAFVNSWTVYLSELFRGGIENVERGQYEAGMALGLNYRQIMREIVLPQAVAATLPGVTNQAIEAIWGTALLSTIGMNDILKSARSILMRDFSLEPFILAGLFYLLFNCAVMILFRTIESRVTRYRRCTP